MIVLKLGGSVITEKDRPDTLDGDALDRAADALGEAIGASVESNGERGASGADLALVHGGGSFGHPHASEHGVSETAGSHDTSAVTDVHGAMRALNGFVLSRLHDRDVPAVPVHPLSAAHRNEAATLSLPVGQVETLLGEGFVPVLHGDVIAHEGTGVTVASGDELAVSLAERLDADRVGFCSAVPGVLDGDGEVVPEIASYDAVADALGGSDATDVTGGMAGKVRTLLDLDSPAAVFGLDGLSGFLSGSSPGTRIDG